ncbi:hypothetical protein MPSEU_000236700 [Mayamaea pseudoterrestris]|nr:hypothetical protein MPSEU_000236700 [Mayamaea pseudoterrestris]
MASLRNRKQPAKAEKEETTLDESLEETAINNLNNESSSPTSVTPLRIRHSLMRLDVFPFSIAYMTWISLDHSQQLQEYRLFISLGLSLTLLLHLSLVLASTWNVGVRAMVGFRTVSKHESLSIWTHALVRNSQDGEIGIVSLEHDHRNGLVRCNFHESVFICDSREQRLDQALWHASENASSSEEMKKKTVASNSRSTSSRIFRPRFYPIHLPLSFYTSTWKGHASLASLATAHSIYGPNRCALQPPTYLQLLCQQLIAPLFLFQVFCVGLWCLDEYWYYAIYTLLALLLFESTVAYQRHVSLAKLQKAGSNGTRARQKVYVRRQTQWMQVYAHELLPGDLMSLSCNQKYFAEHTTMVVPADVLLIAGTAVCDESLLTGESVPQLKHALEESQSPHDDETLLDLTDKEHKESILFAGTGLIAATNTDAAKEVIAKGSSNSHENSLYSPPDGGVVAIVLRTGFETTQGSLLRTMAYSSSKSGAHGNANMDTYIFIFILLCCAIFAAATVLKTGWHDDRRNRFRLLLHVVMIITSVVPPELPMELSLAVTNSVAALMQKCQVYCTEIHRIPWAGAVDVVCFDKTGTLTSDEMQLKGVCYLDEGGMLVSTDMIQPNADDKTLPVHSLMVMAACHSLALVGDGGRSSIVGDPLERVVLQETGYRLIGNDTVAMVDEAGGRVSHAYHVLHRYTFLSKLKRMTTLVTENEGQGMVYTLSKGAPETVRDMLKVVPSQYDETARFHMSKGRRVLAMAYGDAGKLKDLRNLKANGRESFEKNLVFAGFLVLDCPLKLDSKTVVTELRKSGHSVLMCTGDALLTAVEVAKQVSIVKRKHIVYNIQKRRSKALHLSDPLTSFECVSLDEKSVDAPSVELSSNAIKQLKDMRGEASFCITGDVLVDLAAAAVSLNRNNVQHLDEKHVLLHPDAQSALARLVPLISVFARHAPHQKEALIAAFNCGGHCTLMCGDGTNDVGALKRARVGISILSAPEVESKQRHASEAIAKSTHAKKCKIARKHGSGENPLHQLREAEKQLDELELGDASVAAPFTSRAVSIKCCKDVIQQGRCTLVTMLSIYKILGINCLVNAMVLSKLFLNGVKQGDRQMTILGIVITALFYFITRADPLPILSSERPPSSVMCLRALLSIGIQCAVHCFTIALVTDVSISFVDPFDPSLVPDGAFNANSLNTTAFLITCLATVNTFAVNYRGRPFMADLTENKLFYRSLQVCYATLFILVTECFPPLNDLFQLSQLPAVVVDMGGSKVSGVLDGLVLSVGFPTFIGGLMMVDTVLVYGAERMLR